MNLTCQAYIQNPTKRNQVCFVWPVLTQNQKAAISAELNYFSNKFRGNANNPVAYQMMEGLQPGTNFTWSLIAQKRLTKYLDLNLNYFGRKTETSQTIHTGTVQLKAYF